MHRHPRAKLLGSAVAALLAIGCAATLPASAGAHPKRHGYVYVNDNTAGRNSVAGFARRADGRLRPLPGSPFRTGGAGTGSGLASQGAVQVSSDGRFVIAVDAGSDEISILRITRHGALRLVSGGSVSSRGDQPVSVAEHDGLVYVANAGAGGSNYTAFTLSRRGRLRAVRHSTFPLPGDAQPGDVLFDPTGAHLIGVRVNSSQIDSFRVSRRGRLEAAPGSPFGAEAEGPFGSAFSPTSPHRLFVSNAHAGPGNGTVSAFRVAADGTLAAIAGSPFPDHQTAPCWVEVTRDGRYLFAVNTAAGTISRYAIGRGGALALLGSTDVADQPGAGAVDARLSTDGRTLYVNASQAGAIAAFRVRGGELSRKGAVPLPRGAAAAGLAVR